jgi:CheY-like chemotaxis protein
MEALIADDHNLTRMLLGSAVTKLWRHLHEATHGRGAWAAGNAGNLPLIVSDWMTSISGGFCHRIRPLLW